jgi:thioesterase domain-containing protein
LEDIAAYHVRTILETQPHGPYFLGGWSDSGVLAYEVARQLRQQAHPVALLVLFDAEAQLYAQHFSGINLLRARVHSFGQWVKINWKLLRNSERSEAVRRIREGLTFRVAWMKQRFREIMYGIHPVLQTENDHENRERILAFAVANYHRGLIDGRVVLFQRAARLTGPYHVE